MESYKKNYSRQTGIIIILSIAIFTLFTIIINILALIADSYQFVQNLFYIPIIVSCFFYEKHGFLFSVILSILYLILALVLSGGPEIFIGAVTCVLIFIGVADLTTFFSQNRTSLKGTEENEARYRELFNNMSSGVAVYEVVNNGNDFVFRDFSHAAERIEDISKEEVLGHSVLEIFPGIKKFRLYRKPILF